MNKAFVKDNDGEEEGRCPQCGAIGDLVGLDTLREFVKPDSQEKIADEAFFCPTDTCPIVYFDHFERKLGAEDLTRPVYPKDLEAPICGCFGFTRDDADKDVQEGVPTRIRALLEKSKSPQAVCGTKSANGQCCIPEVQKYYMHQKNKAPRP